MIRQELHQGIAELGTGAWLWPDPLAKELARLLRAMLDQQERQAAQIRALAQARARP
jgi:hypothetical protein